MLTRKLTSRDDSLASRSLSLRPFRSSRGFPSRSILDFAGNDSESSITNEIVLAGETGAVFLFVV